MTKIFFFFFFVKENDVVFSFCVPDNYSFDSHAFSPENEEDVE